MENERQAPTFIDGMTFQAVSQNAPETVRGKIYFNWTKFKEFAEKNVNERGYINVKMMKSKNNGSIYFIKDDFVPNAKTEETKEYNEQKYRTQELSQKQQSEVAMGDKLFNNGLSDEDLQVMADMPF